MTKVTKRGIALVSGIRDISARENIVNLVIALFVAFSIVFGYQISVLRNFNLGILAVLFAALLAVCFWFVLDLMTVLLDRREEEGFARLPYFEIKHKTRSTVLAGVVILCCWMPLLLAGFPGFFNYDASTGWLMQWSQIESGVLNAHHPVLHTLFLEATIKAGMTLFGSFNAGVFVSVSVQAVLIAGMFAGILCWMARSGMGRIGLTCVTAYLALDPIIGVFALSTTKDSLFAAIVLLYCLSVYFFFMSDSAEGFKPIMLGMNVVLGFLMMSLRANALVGMVLIVPSVALLLKKAKGRWKAYLSASVIGIVLTLMWLGPVSALMHVESSPIGKWNSLCIMEQQIARCSVDEDVSEKDRKEIQEKLPGIEYKANLSDVARRAFLGANRCNSSELTQLYVDLGLKYPKVYLEALLYQTEDAWSPFSTINCYQEEGNGQTSVFEVEQKDPSERHTRFQPLLDVIAWVSTREGIEAIPVVGLIVSIPFYLLLLLLCVGRCFAKRKHIALACLLPLLVLTLTNLLGPCMLLRYFLYLIFGAPLMLYIAFGNHAIPCRKTG